MGWKERQKKLEKRKSIMKKHGRTLGEIYKNSLGKKRKGRNVFKETV